VTATCKHCGRDIALRYVGPFAVWGHLVNPGNNHHYAVPVKADTAGVQASRTP
jgi:hypothetical protein